MGWPDVVGVLRDPGTVSSITCAEFSRNGPFVGYVVLPVVIKAWLLWAHSCVSLTLRLANCEDQVITTVYKVLCRY